MTLSQKQQLPHGDLVMCRTTSYIILVYKRLFKFISNGLHHNLDMQEIIEPHLQIK